MYFRQYPKDRLTGLLRETCAEWWESACFPDGLISVDVRRKRRERASWVGECQPELWYQDFRDINVMILVEFVSEPVCVVEGERDSSWTLEIGDSSFLVGASTSLIPPPVQLAHRSCV